MMVHLHVNDVTFVPARKILLHIISASTRENLSSEVCEQQRHRTACASAQVFRLLERIISILAMREI